MFNVETGGISVDYQIRRASPSKAISIKTLGEKAVHTRCYRVSRARQERVITVIVPITLMEGGSWSAIFLFAGIEWLVRVSR